MKNKLGKITFISLCAFLVLYGLYNLYAIVFLYKTVNYDLNMIIDGYKQMDFGSFINSIHNFYIGPMISWTMVLIYTIIIGKGKSPKPFVYLITALAIFDGLLFTILGGFLSLSYIRSIISSAIISLIFIAFIFVFLMLFFDYKKKKWSNAICITAVLVYIADVIYYFVFFIIDIFSVGISNVFMNMIAYILYCGSWMIAIIIYGLVLGYILFPEKYIKIEEPNEE